MSDQIQEAHVDEGHDDIVGAVLHLLREGETLEAGASATAAVIAVTADRLLISNAQRSGSTSPFAPCAGPSTTSSADGPPRS